MFSAEFTDFVDYEHEYDSSISMQENEKNILNQYHPEGRGQSFTRKEMKHQVQQLHQQAVEQHLGMTFSNFEGEPSIKMLPRTIKRKGLEITINAPILVDENELKNAIGKALLNVAEAIRADVTQARASVFADSRGKWSFPDGGYSDAASYYSSGMIPYWKGGLLGSFKVDGARSRVEYALSFRSCDYAETIENGGAVVPNAAEWSGWASDKNIPSQQSKLSINAHPFMGSVTYKLQSNLQNFGYLDIFANTFLVALK